MDRLFADYLQAAAKIHLPEKKKDQETNIFLEGYQELDKIFRKVRTSKKLSYYLIGFFFVMMGLLTVMFMAATYGEKEIGLSEEILIPTILIIQFVGMGGSWLFSRLSGRYGNLQALLISVIIWIFICIGAFFIMNSVQFMIAAFFIGIVMGGSQSLARSTYSKMLPEDTTDHTSYFSFYDVMEKLATVAGTFSFGIIEAITGSMRYSVLSIATFFVIGTVFLLMTYKVVAKSNRESSVI